MADESNSYQNTMERNGTEILSMKSTLKTFCDNNITDQYINSIPDESPIRNFYKDKSIFLTGGSGFFGKIIIEKLLRVTEVNHIYVLVRTKKGKDAYTRMDELFNDPIFGKMKAYNPKYRQQITIINGDCALPNLGIAPNERELIKDNVNIIIHGAATVRFDEKLKMAISINVNGTKEMLKLAKEVLHLKAFVHISTAFANCNHKFIQERFYNTTITGESACNLGNCLDEHTLHVLTPTIIKGYPNTYTYTKALAENIIQNNAGNLPITIFRPGIVITTFKDPLPGWIDNMYGPCGMIVGVGSGILRICKARKNNTAHLVPVDLCVNALLASAWDIARISYDSPPIYNYVPDPENVVTWGNYLEFGLQFSSAVPLSKSIWYPRFTLTLSIWKYLILRFFYHTFPALIMDLCMIMMCKKPRMLKMYRKIHKFCSVLEYFSSNDFVFENNNIRSLSSKLELVDKKLFEFDMRKINWTELFRVSLTGMRIYLIKDDPSNMEHSKKRFQRLKILHYSTLFIVYSLLLYFFVLLCKLIFW